MRTKYYRLRIAAIIISMIGLMSLSTLANGRIVLAAGTTGIVTSSSDVTTIPGLPIIINSEADKVVYSFNDQIIHLAGSIQPLLSVRANDINASSNVTAQPLTVHYQAYNIAESTDVGKSNWNVTGDVPLVLYGNRGTNIATFSVSLVNPGYLDHREGIYAIMLTFEGRKHLVFFMVQQDLSVQNIFYREL